MLSAYLLTKNFQLFAPVQGARRFSRLNNAEAIMSRNAEAATARTELSHMLAYYRLARQMTESSGEVVSQCNFQ